MAMTAGKRWGVAVVAVILIVAALAVFKVQEIMGAIAFAQSFPEPQESVEIYVVESVSYQPTRKVFAEVVAPQRLELRNELGGAIERVGFSAGETVKAGQVLVQLDVREERARLQAIEAREVLARRTFERNQKLFQQQRISEQVVDESRAELNALRADITQIEVQIDKKQITAPFAARAGIHHLEVGELLPAQTVITTLIGLGSELWLDFELPQRAMRLEPGDEISVLAGDKRFTASIVARDSELSDSSRNLRYRAAFSAEDNRLLPHAVVNVEVPDSESREVALIPDTALRVDQLGNFVYVLQADSDNVLRAQRRQVDVGARRNNEVAVLSGLSVGDRIAAKGAFKLNDNTRVSTRSDDQAAEPAQHSVEPQS